MSCNFIDYNYYSENSSSELNYLCTSDLSTIKRFCIKLNIRKMGKIFKKYSIDKENFSPLLETQSKDKSKFRHNRTIYQIETKYRISYVKKFDLPLKFWTPTQKKSQSITFSGTLHIKLMGDWALLVMLKI